MSNSKPSPEVRNARGQPPQAAKLQKSKKQNKSKKNQKKPSSSSTQMAPRQAMSDSTRAKGIQMEAVQATISVPSSGIVTRVGDPYCDVPTATASPFMLFDVSTEGMVPDQLLGASDRSFKLVTTRDPLRSMVYTLFNPNHLNFVAQHLFQTDQTALEFSNVYRFYTGGGFSLSTIYPDLQLLKDTLPGATDRVHCYGPEGVYFPVTQKGNQLKWFWFDGIDLPNDGTGINSTFLQGAISVVDWTLTNQVLVRLYAWDNGVAILQPGTITWTVTALVTQNISITKPGYYAYDVEVSAVDGPPGTRNEISFGMASIYQYPPLNADGLVYSVINRATLPLPGYYTNRYSIQALRVMGVSSLTSNTSAEFYRGGNAFAVQLPSSNDFQNVVLEPNPMTTYSRVPSQWSGDAKNGVYTWMRPTAITDFQFQTPATFDEGGAVQQFFSPMESLGSYVVSYINATDSSSALNLHAKVVVAFSVEYRSTNNWIPTSMPDMDFVVFNQGLEALRMVPQFSENPVHWKKVWDAITKGTLSVLKHTALAAPALVSLFAPGSGVAMAGANLARAIVS